MYKLQIIDIIIFLLQHLGYSPTEPFVKELHFSFGCKQMGGHTKKSNGVLSFKYSL